MDFGLLPPEVNSGRMYAGPGSRPMLVTSAAWSELAVELSITAASYQSVTVELVSGPWLGQALESILSAVARYATWLCLTATLAKEAAAQSRAVAVIHEAARSTTVHPSVIAANRKLRTSMVETNLLAQCAPAIADIDAHYEAMWAQDADAMYCYADASATASKLQPFTEPPAVAGPASPAAQREAVAQSIAAAKAVGVCVQEIVSAGSRVISAVPQALHALASPSSTDVQLSSVSSSLSGFDFPDWHGRIATSTAAESEVGALEPAGSSGQADRLVSAGIGRAASLGELSVPQNWSAATSAPTPVAPVLPGPGWDSDLPSIVSVVGCAVGSLGTTTTRVVLRPNLVPRCPKGG